MKNPRLWWPHGYGDQPLYQVRVSLLDGDDSELDVWERKIGLRTMTVNTDKDEWGSCFAHEVNGVKIFAMGADYIPEDNLLDRVNKERTRRLLEDAAMANHNCIRVWGGGYYPDDWFYDICDELGLLVWQEFPDTPDQVFGRFSKLEADLPKSFDVFLSFNFLEHQPEPDVMLRAIWNNLSEDGMGLVTVPALEYILEQGSYYELLRDHIAYYSFGTLKNLMERNGFTVLEEQIINRDTIEAVVKKNPGWKEGTEEFSEKMISTDSLTEGYRVTNQEMEELLDRLEKKGKSLAVWGASHQGFTLAATTRLGAAARYMIDSAPFKQGRYAPASHLPITAPEHFFEEPVDAVLIAAPGYSDEIAGTIRERFGGQVEILTLRTKHIEKL